MSGCFKFNPDQTSWLATPCEKNWTMGLASINHGLLENPLLRDFPSYKPPYSSWAFPAMFDDTRGDGL